MGGFLLRKKQAIRGCAVASFDAAKLLTNGFAAPTILAAV